MKKQRRLEKIFGSNIQKTEEISKNMINYYKDFTQNPETEDNLSRYINYHPYKSKSKLDDIY